MSCIPEWPVEGACAIGYCHWKGDGFETIGEVEDAFAQACQDADELLGEPTASRWFLNWFDDTPRDQMRRMLLAELEQSLSERLTLAPAPVTRAGAA
jgi:hypothetical protein